MTKPDGAEKSWEELEQEGTEEFNDADFLLEQEDAILENKDDEDEVSYEIDEASNPAEYED